METIQYSNLPTLLPELSNLLNAIENGTEIDFDTEDLAYSNISKLAILSRFSVLMLSPGLSAKNVSNDNIKEVFYILDEAVGAFTDQSKCERVREINPDDAHIVMVSWLSDLIEYFGKSVLLDAEVVLLTLADFSKLSMVFQYKYFENTLGKVRKWFKILRKKLKPFLTL